MISQLMVCLLVLVPALLSMGNSGCGGPAYPSFSGSYRLDKKTVDGRVEVNLPGHLDIFQYPFKREGTVPVASVAVLASDPKINGLLTHQPMIASRNWEEGPAVELAENNELNASEYTYDLIPTVQKVDEAGDMLEDNEGNAVIPSCVYNLGAKATLRFKPQASIFKDVYPTDYTSDPSSGHARTWEEAWVNTEAWDKQSPKITLEIKIFKNLHKDSVNCTYDGQLPAERIHEITTTGEYVLEAPKDLGDPRIALSKEASAQINESVNGRELVWPAIFPATTIDMPTLFPAN